MDDGSSDGSGQIAQAAGARVYRHLINRGLGGALATGIQAAIRAGAEYIVTFDADGQHEAKDILRIIEPLEKGVADVVVGSRMLVRDKTQPRMPLRRRLYNAIGNRITLFMFGLQTSDSQSGLREFTRQAARTLHLQSNRMEVSTEIMYEVKRHAFRLSEVPIAAIYTEYSMSKGQSFGEGVRTFFRLLLLRLLK
ncbi:MAG: glycosyltransferase family 2 protein [Candidatus Nomurabacteria bacterium]|nr:MAG: glycosyltransferase family 2 protein [Candidatus Nomurabacteria bacterium]